MLSISGQISTDSLQWRQVCIVQQPHNRNLSNIQYFTYQKSLFMFIYVDFSMPSFVQPYSPAVIASIVIITTRKNSRALTCTTILLKRVSSRLLYQALMECHYSRIPHNVVTFMWQILPRQFNQLKRLGYFNNVLSIWYQIFVVVWQDMEREGQREYPASFCREDVHS